MGFRNIVDRSMGQSGVETKYGVPTVRRQLAHDVQSLDVKCMLVRLPVTESETSTPKNRFKFSCRFETLVCTVMGPN